MPFRPGPIDCNALYSVMFQSAGPANRDGHSHDGSRHPGYINLRTLAIAYLPDAEAEPQEWFGEPVACEAALNRAAIEANPDEWLAVPVWTGKVGDHAGGEEFVREFVKQFLGSVHESGRGIEPPNPGAVLRQNSDMSQCSAACCERFKISRFFPTTCCCAFCHSVSVATPQCCE
jgi:hypothetical protein